MTVIVTRWAAFWFFGRINPLSVIDACRLRQNEQDGIYHPHTTPGQCYALDDGLEEVPSLD